MEMILQFVPFILIFVIMWFLIIRPQQRRVKTHQEMIKNVRRGDTVVTSGGIIGKVTKVVEDSADVEVEIRCQLIGFDQKRFQLYLTMHTARLGDELAATSEFMLVNIDSSGEPKSAPFRPEVAAKLAEIMDAHKTLPLPQNSGRAIALPKRK